MDILCIAKQLSDAQSATAALRDVLPDVKILWTSRFDHAAVWTDEHRTVTALLVHAEVDEQGCAPFLTHIRKKGIDAPAVVIAPQGSRAPFESLHAGADDLAIKGESLPKDLAAAVTRAIARARTLGGNRWDHLRLDTPATSQAEPEARLAEEIRSRATAEELLQQERATRTDLEQKLERTKTTLRDAEERQILALATVRDELSERRSRFESDLSLSVATCDRLQAQLNESEGLIANARDQHAAAAAEVARLEEREAALGCQLADTASARGAFELELAAARLATQEAIDRATRERTAALSKAAEREASLDSRIRQECAARASAEQKLTLLEGTLRDAEQRHASAAMTAATELAELQARFDSESGQAKAARESLTRQFRDAEVALGELRRQHSAAASEIERLTGREVELTSQLDEETAVCTAFEQRLAETEVAITEADARSTRELLLAAERHADVESRLAQEVTSREALQREIAELRTTADASEREHALERSDSANQLAELQEILNRARETAEADVCRLAAERTVAQHELEQARRSFQETSDHASALHAAELASLAATAADRDARIEEQAAHILRTFEESPLAICRCTPDGLLTHSNRAFDLLLGEDTMDELRAAGFGEAVFESADDLPWLIARCLSSEATETIETAWRTKEGVRLTMRLSAFAATPDQIEIIAEDLTTLRALQDRVSQAQRMEAVGRLASEVAVTCGNLLSDVHQETKRWLGIAGADPSLQRQGEMLLGELTRATGFLRQLSAYSNEQASAQSPVELNRVLRDLGPVLKRVAGDDVELELPKATKPMTVDVEGERVERLLVNLASYGRERMPFGGRLKIELGTVVVDHPFMAKYPNVRQGPHALITVTEVRRTARAEGPLKLREWPAESGPDAASSEKIGVDLGALQGLIGECGGHLWMTAASHGDMEVQIRLPLRQSGDRKEHRPLNRRAS